MACIGKADLKVPCFQHIEQRDPVHASGLHHYRLDTAGLQPVGHPLQISRPASEFLHRLRIAARRHGHEMAFVAHVDARHVPVYDLQSRILRAQLSHPFPALLAVQPPVCQTFECRFLSVRHVILSLYFEFDRVRLGGRSLHNLSNGVGPGLFQGRHATNH